MADNIHPKDYIRTKEDLYFAVVLPYMENGRIFCLLRYLGHPYQPPVRLNTREAFLFLKKHHPKYLFFSKFLDTDTIGVAETDILQIYKPVHTIQRILNSTIHDELYRTARFVITHFIENGINQDVLGITGSMMLNFHGPGSDIDFVVYDLNEFNSIRGIIKRAFANHVFQPLDNDMWRKTYKRRDCSLDFKTYLFHETRKFNKFIIAGTKVDISYQPSKLETILHGTPARKLGLTAITATVINDADIFSYPAIYYIDHEEIGEIRVYTATYVGQAFKDERIEAVGMVETTADGIKYMVIGTSREAEGEYLRVTQ